MSTGRLHEDFKSSHFVEGGSSFTAASPWSIAFGRCGRAWRHLVCYHVVDRCCGASAVDGTWCITPVTLNLPRWEVSGRLFSFAQSAQTVAESNRLAKRPAEPFSTKPRARSSFANARPSSKVIDSGNQKRSSSKNAGSSRCTLRCQGPKKYPAQKISSTSTRQNPAGVAISMRCLWQRPQVMMATRNLIKFWDNVSDLPGCFSYK